MSDLDQLAESARNRGLKLIRSRVRTPRKRRFGKVGLADKSGKPVFGMDAKGPNAKPEDVENYLRNLDAKDWGASLDVAAPQRKRTARKPPPAPANDAPARPKARTKATKPKPPPRPQLREARPADSPRLVELIGELGAQLDEKEVRKSLAALRKAGETPLLATLDRQIVGLVACHRMFTVHRPAPVGRMSALVVAKQARGHGIGKLLVEAAEQWCRSRGCEIIEVTSNDRRSEAHAFYRHMGYERTSMRFVKTL